MSLIDVPSSPDIRRYVPLAPFERTAVEVAVAALQDLRATKLPGVTLREGMTEVLLIETLAVIAGDLGIAIDRIPAVVFEAEIRLLGVDRDTGARATVDVEFTITPTGGTVTIPTGTEVTVDVGGGHVPVVFATDADLDIVSPATTGTVAATAADVGALPNGITSGTTVRPRSAVAMIVGAALDTDIAGGRDPESDDAYFLRASQRLARLTEVLVRGSQFTFAALEHELVTAAGRALTIDLYDGSGGPPYTDTGHVTVIVRGPSGNLSSPQKATLQAALELLAVPNLAIHVLDPNITTVNVAATVHILAGYVAADVEAACEAAIEALLDITSWPWAKTVRLSDIIGILEQIPGVDWVDISTVLLNGVAADLALTGDGPLADAGTIAVTAA